MVIHRSVDGQKYFSVCGVDLRLLPQREWDARMAVEGEWITCFVCRPMDGAGRA